MLTYRLNNRAAGTVLTICVIALAFVYIWKQHVAPAPVGTKSDRLKVSPDAGCAFDTWPYGCNWQFDTPEKKQLRPARRSHRRASAGYFRNHDHAT